MFEKLVNVMFPIVIILFVIHLVVFFGAWTLLGRRDPKYQGVIGFVKYYFHTWRESLTAARETYFYEEETNTE